MVSICGSECCSVCPQKERCGGCHETCGHPFGGSCVAARCIQNGGMTAFDNLKQSILREIQSFQMPHLHPDELHLLNGFYVNLAYPLPNGQTVKLLEDSNVYLGNQIEIPGCGRCYGIIADEQYLLVSEYGVNGVEPEIICYKKRL